MGGAMLEGWLKQGIDRSKVSVLDPEPPKEVRALIKQSGLSFNPPINTLFDAQVVVIAVKPQIAGDVLPAIAALRDTLPLVVSIVAGKRLAFFEQHFGARASIVRTMPNTPAAIGRGITAMVANRNVSREQLDLAGALLSAVGEVVTVESESQIDAVTALSGSGPAYVFYLTECMTEAGTKLGLPKEMAAQLARATVAGAAELMRTSGLPAGTLRQNVTSPNGTTQAALQILMADDGMMKLFERALTAAEKRSRELAG
jgi:pyrroline-5-carboxylate reductase